MYQAMEDLAARGVSGSGAARIAHRSGAASYVALTKPRQTGLLMATAIGAYLMGAVPPVEWLTFAVGMLALGAAISGSTALNMVLDRDIDRIMERTLKRPLPSGLVPASRATVFGIALSAVGIIAALLLDPLFGALVTAGLLFDVVVYTWWLKRRTAASILVGFLAYPLGLGVQVDLLWKVGVEDGLAGAGHFPHGNPLVIAMRRIVCPRLSRGRKSPG